MTPTAVPLEGAFLCLLNLAFIGALPRVFFRPGRLHLRWWLTAAPFFVAGGLVVAAALGFLRPVVGPGALYTALTLGAAACAAGSVALMGYTLGTHTRPVSLWHQDDDMPESLITHGAYARVRHPFYLAFLLALAGCALVLPHPATAVVLAAGAVQLHRTARREEGRLLASHLGPTYRRYQAGTGRFMPRVRGPLPRTGRGATVPPKPRPRPPEPAHVSPLPNRPPPNSGGRRAPGGSPPRRPGTPTRAGPPPGHPG